MWRSVVVTSRDQRADHAELVVSSANTSEPKVTEDPPEM